MKAALIAILFLVGCGDNAAVPPDAVPDASLEKCSSLACDFVLCESCPVCGHPETTCTCNRLNPPPPEGLGDPIGPGEACAP